MRNTLERRQGATASSNAPEQATEDVRQWVASMVELCQPDEVRWLNGSEQEKQELLAEGVKDGTFIQLNHEKLPNCYLHRSNPNDVARSEHCTFICTPSADMAGPTNNWMSEKEAYAKLRGLFNGSMRRAHDVRGAVCHGADRLAAGEGGGGGHRFALRGGLHGDHDADGGRGVGATGRVSGFHALPAQRGRLQSRAAVYLPFPAG